tara:strand:- start:1373 stop:2188 length:816 start_codon:yes stop_codon:yes gene_type:complete
MKLKGKDGKIKRFAIGGVIGGGVQAVAGVGQAIYGAQQLRKANAQMDELLAGAPKLGLPSAYEQYAAKALDQSALRQQTEAINRRLATSTDALGKAGGRALLGGLQSQVTTANTSELQAQDAQRQREMQGLQVLGNAQAQNQQMKENRFRMQYGAADAAKQAALGNIAGGLGSAAGGAMQAGLESGGMFGGQKGASAKTRAAFDNLPRFNKGAKLEGEFSHENNPITMTNKQGKVVGEATGSEYIINPKQAAAIKKESKYFRNLLSQKRFK